MLYENLVRYCLPFTKEPTVDDIYDELYIHALTQGTSDVPSAPPIHNYTEDTDSDIRHETDDISQPANPRNAGLGPREMPSQVTNEPDLPSQNARSVPLHLQLLKLHSC